MSNDAGTIEVQEEEIETVETENADSVAKGPSFRIAGKVTVGNSIYSLEEHPVHEG